MNLSLVNAAQLILIAVALVGILLIAANPRLRAICATMFALAALMAVNLFEELGSAREIWPVSEAFRALFPALFFLVVRGLILARPSLTMRSWPHALPFAFALALSPIAIAVNAIAWATLLGYSSASLVLIFRFHRMVANARSDLVFIRLRWIYGITAILFLVEVSDNLRTGAHWLHAMVPWLLTEDAYLVQLAAAYITAIGFIYLAVNQHSKFEGLPALPAHKHGELAKLRDVGGQLGELFAELDEKVRSQQLYTESRLTRGELADMLDMREKDLSAAIQLATGLNFNEYINRFRVEEVKRLLAEDVAGNTGRSLLDMAFTAGFSSKSSFNYIFKSETGNSPSAFRRMLKSG
jgi:AraC-like DNA-binding protein